MFHCHNLIHEDNDMMASFNVTRATTLGYDASELVDPMADTFRAKTYVNNDLVNRVGAFSNADIREVIKKLTSFKAYDNPDWTVLP